MPHHLPRALTVQCRTENPFDLQMNKDWVYSSLGGRCLRDLICNLAHPLWACYGGLNGLLTHTLLPNTSPLLQKGQQWDTTSPPPHPAPRLWAAFTPLCSIPNWVLCSGCQIQNGFQKHPAPQMLVQMAACRSGNPRALTGSWAEWQAWDQTSHFAPLAAAQHLALVSCSFPSKGPLLHRSPTTITLMDAEQMERENLAITEASCPRTPAPLQKRKWWSVGPGHLMCSMWAPSVSLAPRMAQLERKGVGIFRQAFFSCSGFTAQPSHSQGGRDTAGEGRETASVSSP